LEYDPDDIQKLVTYAETNNAKVVYGSRNKGNRSKYIYPHYYYGAKLISTLLNIIYRQKLSDPETCYKLILTDLMKRIHLSENGFGIEIELTAKISKLKIPIHEVSISYSPRSFEEGKKIRAKDGIRALWLIIKFYFTK